MSSYKKCKCYRTTVKGDVNGKLHKLFDLTYKAHYQIQSKYNPKTSLPLKHFGRDMQEFLIKFYSTFWSMANDDGDRDKLIDSWEKAEIPKNITDYLLNFDVEEEKNYDFIVVLKNVDKNKDASICKFREELSGYLKRNQEKIKELLSAVNENKDFFWGSVIEVMNNLKAKNIRDILIRINPSEEQRTKFIEEYGRRIKVLGNVSVEGNMEGIEVYIGSGNYCNNREL